MNDSLMTENSAAAFFQTGGTLKASAPSYIERSADTELYQCTMAGTYAYVLTSRQMGKSSLMTRTADRLRKDGVHVAALDLTGIGGDAGSMTADAWYYSLAHNMLRELEVTYKLSVWWKEQAMLPPLNRLMNFFQDVLLTCIQGKIVVFVDEIDTTIKLPFSDDFFAAIRACFNARAKQSEFDRLSFVLLGVASPADLIHDPTRTPFNIGKRIELSDFNSDEAKHFIHGLSEDNNIAEDLFKRLIYWTNGHPYLTQKLCALMRDKGVIESSVESLVDKVVKAEFLGEGTRIQEDSLKLIEDRITKDEINGIEMIKVYAKVCKGKRVQDQVQSATHAALKLSGLVKADQQGKLIVRNRIYQRVFNTRWVNRVRPVRWKQRSVIGSVVTLVMVFSWWIGAQQLTLQSGISVILAWTGIAYPEPEMVKIPAGSFQMGSPEDEIQRYSNEGPQHKVTFTQAFFMGVHEVTFDEYDVFIFLHDKDSCVGGDGNKYTATRPSDSGWGRGKRPVINISWFDARCYGLWLSAKTGKNYRLPTEAEWEYAARAGTITPFSFGEKITPELVNYNGERPYAKGEKGLSRGQTVQVKSLPANAWGLYEMHGNVWEWTADWFGEYPKDEVTNPAGLNKGDYRVVRGGSWFDNGRYCRSAYRDYYLPVNADSDFGFRLALGQAALPSK